MKLRTGWLLGRGKALYQTLLFGEDQFAQLGAAQPIHIAFMSNADLVRGAEQLFSVPLDRATRLGLCRRQNGLDIESALRSINMAGGLHRRAPRCLLVPNAIENALRRNLVLADRCHRNLLLLELA